MGSAHDLLGIGALAVVAEAAGKAVGVLVQCAGLGADLALAGLAGTFPVNAGFVFRHGVLLVVNGVNRPCHHAPPLGRVGHRRVVLSILPVHRGGHGCPLQC